EIVLGDQHLAQVVVAVAAYLHARARRRRPAVDAREQPLALVEQGPGFLVRGRGQTLRRALQERERGARLFARALAARRDVLGAQRLGIERGVALAPRERKVQLGGARGEHAGDGEERAVHVGGRRFGRGALLLEIALEVAHGIVPAVPLVLHVGLEQGEGARRPPGTAV